MRRAASLRRPRRNRARRGFSLVEVMVAMTLLAIGLSSMVALSAKLAVQSRTHLNAGLRNAVLAETVDRLQALPYAGLPAASSTTTVTNAAFPYTLTITRTVPIANTPRVRFAVTVTPTRATSLARTVTVERAAQSNCILNTAAC